MVVHIYNSSTGEVEVGGSWVQGQSQLYTNILPKKKKEREREKESKREREKERKNLTLSLVALTANINRPF
jgi:hypothetical protein